MNPRLRYALVVAISAVVAALVGWQVAEGSVFSFDFGGLVSGVAVLAAVTAVSVRLFRQPPDVILLGLVTIGYIVGNRGFAQLTPLPMLPLFPAELALGAGLSWMLVDAAHARRLPLRRDALNWAVVAWLVAGTARVVFDLPRYGFLAVRDFAMIYYALFFFVAQYAARRESAARFLAGCLICGLAVLPPVFAAYQAFPTFFLTEVTIRNVPLIYFKGDLVNTFLGIGSLLIFFAAPERQRVWIWPLTSGMFVYVLAGGNRASMVGLVVATLLLLAARRWKFPAWQLGATAFAALLVFGLAVVFNNSWAERKIDGVADRVRSLTDVRGLRTYLSEESFDKGDNNRFRLVWWKNVLLETLQEDPVFGRGFGSDLAHGFLQEYYPDATEEFTARSPHNVVLTIFGRMGCVGIVVWLALCAALLRRTWSELRHGSDPQAWGLWCSAWAILCSACFGVVLEGPMGAVPFWLALGLANARLSPNEAPRPAPVPPAAEPEPALAADSGLLS
jgi:O-antigen ligase